MDVIQHVRDMQRWSEDRRRGGQTVAFVPTMGFLHEGHLSLVREAKARGDVVVVSIFVNPMQFNQSSDFDTYPRDAAHDERLLRDLGVDVLFMPPPAEVYPDGYQTAVEVEEVTKPLCGAFRPGHFRGVATVVAKLFNMVKPHCALFGEKDFQQCVVIKRMVRDLNFDIDIVTMPTVREADGLAMSSRNARLSAAERTASLRIFRALEAARACVADGRTDANAVLRTVHAVLDGDGRGVAHGTPDADIAVRAEYVCLCDPETLEEVRRVSAPTLLAIAAWVGDVRLIDNCVLG